MLTALGNRIPLPVNAKVLAVFAANGDDFRFERNLLRGAVKLLEQSVQLSVGGRRAAEDDAVGDSVLRQLAWIEGVERFVDVLRLRIAEGVGGERFRWRKRKRRRSSGRNGCQSLRLAGSGQMAAVEGIGKRGGVGAAA